MIDPSMTDVLLSDETPISLPMAVDKIKARDEKIKELEGINKDLNDSVSYWRTIVAAYESKVERIRDYVISEMNDSDFDEDAAQTIADIMNFSLAKEHYFTVTVQFSGTVEVSPGEDAEEIISNMQYDMNDSYYTDVDFQLDDVSVESVDIEQA